MNKNKVDVLQTLLLCDRIEGRRTAPRHMIEALAKLHPRLTGIMTIGGYETEGGEARMTKAFFVYNIAKGTWSRSPHTLHRNWRLSNEFYGEYAAVLDDGTVLYIGRDDHNYVMNALILNPYTNATEKLDILEAIVHADRLDASLVALPDGRVARLGGRGAAHRLFPKNSVFDPKTRKWSIFEIDVKVNSGALCLVLNTGEQMVIGGKDEWVPGEMAKCVIYNLKNGTARPTPDMTRRRFRASGCVMADGNVFVFGGDEPLYTPVDFTYEVYNVEKNEWTNLGKAPANSPSHSCILLDNGDIFVSGNIRVPPQIYTPATNAFREVPIMLPDGPVLPTLLEHYLCIPLYD
jgi:hypothetical protein